MRPDVGRPVRSGVRGRVSQVVVLRRTYDACMRDVQAAANAGPYKRVIGICTATAICIRTVISIFSTANTVARIPLNRPLIPAVQYRGLIEIAYRIPTVLTVVIPIIMANGGLVMRNNFGASNANGELLMASGTPIMHVLKASQMKQQRRIT